MRLVTAVSVQQDLDLDLPFSILPTRAQLAWHGDNAAAASQNRISLRTFGIR